MVQKVTEDLKKYLHFIENSYGWCIRIHNVALIAGKFAHELDEFTSHANSYCKYIKSDDRAWKRCLQGKQKIMNKAAGGSFYGECHCGVGEYIFPVYHAGKPVGFVSVGEFRKSMKESYSALLNAANSYGLSYEAVSSFYEESISENIPDMDTVSALTQPAVRMLEYISSLMAQTSNEQQEFHSSKVIMNYRILNYIRHSYNKPISVKSIADFCNCSESYINHLFKKMNNTSVSDYINKYRIKKSEELLLATNYTVAQIAFDVGFNEPGYYSSVFKRINKISPKEYRKLHETK